MKKTSLLLFVLPAAAIGGCKFLYSQIVPLNEQWPNGEDMVRGTLVGGKQNGPFTYCYESGRIRSTGEYRDERRFGPWKFYFESGALKRAGSFDAKGLKTGDWKYSNEDRTPKQRGTYWQDLEDGLAALRPGGGLLDQRGQCDDLGTGERPLTVDDADGLAHPGALRSVIGRNDGAAGQEQGQDEREQAHGDLLECQQGAGLGQGVAGHVVQGQIGRVVAEEAVDGDPHMLGVRHRSRQLAAGAREVDLADHLGAEEGAAEEHHRKGRGMVGGAPPLARASADTIFGAVLGKASELGVEHDHRARRVEGAGVHRLAECPMVHPSD